MHATTASERQSKLLSGRPTSSYFPAFSPRDHGKHFIHLSTSTIVCLLLPFSSCYCWQFLSPVWAAVVPWSLSSGFRVNWLCSFRRNFMSTRTINRRLPKARCYSPKPNSLLTLPASVLKNTPHTRGHKRTEAFSLIDEILKRGSILKANGNETLSEHWEAGWRKQASQGLESIMWLRLQSGRFKQIETEAVAQNRLRWGCAVFLWGYHTSQALKAEQSPSTGKFLLSARTASAGLSLLPAHTSSGLKLAGPLAKKRETFYSSPPPSPSCFLAAAGWVLPFSAKHQAGLAASQ